MAPYAVSITKKVTWRGVDELFSNVYHYDTSSPISTDSGWDSLIDQIVALEKPAFSNVVTWVQGRVWGPTGSGPSVSETQRIKDLSGTGSLTVSTAIPYEASIVASFYIGRAPGTGRKRFLRKFFHTCGLASSSSGSQASLGNGPLAAGDKTAVTTLMNGLKTISVASSPNDLCTPNGTHLPAGSSPDILPHTHIRQFKQ